MHFLKKYENYYHEIYEIIDVSFEHGIQFLIMLLTARQTIALCCLRSCSGFSISRLFN